MTRRIAVAILLAVWAVLLAGGITGYWTVRAILVADLDALLFARASALPELLHPKNFDPGRVPPRDWRDSYTIREDSGGTLGATGPSNLVDAPKLVGARFSRPPPEGKRVRILTIRASAKGPSPKGRVPVTVTYIGSTERIDAMLWRLARALLVFCIAGALFAATLAHRISRLALAPLLTTAEQIGTIDEHALQQRIDTSKLPDELVAVAQRLNDLFARLESAFARRKRFVAGASHELRTPVAALVTSVEIALRHPRHAAAYREALEAVLSDAKMMRRLVERLMEQVRSELPEHAEAPSVTNVTRLLDRCADTAASLAGEHSVKIVRSLAPDVWCSLPAERLRSVVTNLLSNAVQYNRPGDTVELACAHDGKRLRISVRDTGPGIAPEHLPQLFDPFFRADAARHNSADHLGLGLFLVQSHAKAMGGECRAESRLGEGTTFYVDLPCANLRAGAAVEEPARPAQPV